MSCRGGLRPPDTALRRLRTRPSSRDTCEATALVGPRLPLAQLSASRLRVRYLWVMTVPRHELPGRIVLTVGLVTSWFCVVGLIILWLG